MQPRGDDPRMLSRDNQVGWLELDTVTVLKDMDPVSWRCAQSEWESQEADEGNIVSLTMAQPITSVMM